MKKNEQRTQDELLKHIADILINDRIDLYGIIQTIQFLCDIGVDEKELIALGFSIDDIKAASDETETK